jgi:hypothetical protein
MVGVGISSLSKEVSIEDARSEFSTFSTGIGLSRVPGEKPAQLLDTSLTEEIFEWALKKSSVELSN